MRLEKLFFLAGCLAGLCFGAGRAAHASGPIFVNRSARLFVWDSTRPIRYTVDPGPLGPFSNAQAVQWVVDAFHRWASVDGVALTVQAPSSYPRDITGKNIWEVLNTLPSNRSLILFDEDGSVMDAVFGEGTGDTVYGFTLSEAGGRGTTTLGQAVVVINGRHSKEYAPEYWQRLIQHEVGHFLGLSHSQLNPQVTFDGDPTNDALAPCMSYDGGPNRGPTLHADDRAWIAALYPKADQPARTGTIRGRVLLPDGKTGLQGIQVVARRDGDEEVTAVSGVSGYLYKSQLVYFGSRNVALQGSYELPGLPPGNYRLAIESLADVPQMRPRSAILPGGPRFWRESGSLATQPHEATLVAVGAGQVLEGKDFRLEGPSQPPGEVAELEPNDSAQTAQPLTLSAVVSGRVGARDGKSGEFPVPDESRDAVEDWYRIVLTEPTTLSATLTAGHPDADLNLYLVSSPSGTPELELLDRSVDRGTPPETFQARVGPGVYFVGVSSFDEHPVNADSDYRLTLIGIPSPDPAKAAPNPPRITLATVSDVTPSSLRVSWQTDQDANTLLYVRFPWRELGSPALTREHSLDVTGLSAATQYLLRPVSRSDSGEMEVWPNLAVPTAQTASGSEPDLVLRRASARRDQENREFVLGAYVTNRGNGPAAGVRIDRLALPSGWRFLAPPAFPIDLGSIGPGGAGVVAVRVIRTAEDAAPLDLSLEGTYATPEGATRSFRR